MTEVAQMADVIAAMFWTYLIHSTTFLALCAAAIYIANPKSHALTAWLWKSAATLPIATSVVTFVLSMYAMQFGYVIENKLFVADHSASDHMSSEPMASSNEVVPQIEERATQNSVANVDVEAGSKQGASELPRAISSSMSAARPIDHSVHAVPNPLAFSSFAVLVLLVSTLCWCVVKVILFCRCYRKLLKSTTECRSGGLRDELDSFLTSIAIRHPVRLLISDDATQPFALGILRWTIVVPRQVEISLDKKQLSALFAHEVGHLVRRDAVWILIGAFFCTFLAFQPLNFLARRRWLDAAEFLADEWAVRSGVAPLSLVRCLASVAEWQSKVMLRSAMRFANSSVPALTRRAEHLLSYTVQRDTWTTWLCFSATLALTIAGLLFVFFGPYVGELRAEAGISRSFESAQLEDFAHQLRDVVTNLDQIDMHVLVRKESDELTVRVEQLKRRGAQLVERAELLSELSKKDLP